MYMHKEDPVFFLGIVFAIVVIVFFVTLVLVMDNSDRAYCSKQEYLKIRSTENLRNCIERIELLKKAEAR